MMKRSLKCEVIADESVHPEMWKNCNRTFKYIPFKLLNNKSINREQTDEKKIIKVQRMLDGEKQKRERIKELGITYVFPGYSSSVDKARTLMK